MTSPSSSSTTEWPSKISSSWPPTALQNATKQALSRARDEHLLALALLADVERRRGDVDEQLRAGEREVGRGRPRLPDVLADGRADEASPSPRRRGRARARSSGPRRRRRSSAGTACGTRLHLAAGADRARVVEVAVEVRGADERGQRAPRARSVERPRGRADEARPQQQVLGRVAGDGELGEEDEVGARVARLLEAPRIASGCRRGRRRRC